MPYGVGAFMLFGLGSLPAGRLGDLWGRRQMMLVFFFGMGASALLVAAHAQRVAARGRADADGRVLVDLSSGRHSDAGARRAAAGPRDRRQRPRRQPRRRARGRHDRPARQVRRLARGVRRARRCSRSPAASRSRASRRDEPAPPAHGARTPPRHDAPPLARIFVVMTVAAISSSLLFNFTTNGNGQLLRERFAGIVEDPGAARRAARVRLRRRVVRAGRDRPR